MNKLYSGKTGGHQKYFFTLVICLGAQTAWAQQLECISPPLGGPSSSEICALSGVFEPNSYATSVNADGSVVVGRTIAGGGRLGFRWTAAEGMLNLGTLTGGNTSQALGVNSDGGVVVGYSGSSEGERAFRWTAADGMVNLGTLDGGIESRAVGVNADGTVVVGRSRDISREYRAFRWTADNGMIDLGNLTDGSRSLRWTEATAVNSDGSVVVGFSYGNAFRWTETDGMVNLGSLGGNRYSNAYDVNADGTVIVGESSTDAGLRAFRWTAGDGMMNLGILTSGDSSSEALGVNADGSVVVGRSGGSAFRWTAADGMLNLGSLDGSSLSVASGVNFDGSVVVGWSSNRAFIWRKTPSEDTPSGGIMEDFENLITSFPVLANDSAVAQAEQQLSVGQMMSQNGFAGAGHTVISARTEGQRTEKNPTRIGARNNSLASLSLGRGISDNFTLGATVSAQRSSMRNNAFDMGTGYGTAIWGTYNENPEMNTGIQMSGSIGYMRANGDVARGRLLTDVAVATGKARVETRAAQINLGYGISHDDWLVTPNFGLAYYDTRRSSYSENGPTFNANYNAMRTHRTVASLGVDGDYALSDQGTISLGLGVDHELNTKSPSLSGTSDIPGLATFNIDSNFTPNRTRPFGNVGYTHQFENGATVGGDLRVGRAVYGSTSSVGFGLTLNMLF